MSTSARPACAPGWLELRESADAAARASGLLDLLRAHLADAPRVAGRLLIRDLGCGTGSMAAWLSRRLSGPQNWVVQDRDRELLERAGARAIGPAADGSPATAVPRRADITALRGSDLAGTSLVTASALLDLLTRTEVDTLTAACVEAGCAALVTLSVVGRVELDPADPLDDEIVDAFNAHQRRIADGRRLLGPDAVRTATEAFERRGALVRVHPSPWRLGTSQSALMAEWLRGWVAAAREQRPSLGAHAVSYLRRRLDACAEGELRAVVHHADLLALPGAVP